jgi:hypothetical protein
MEDKKVYEQEVNEAELEEICAVNCMTCDVN